jgi:hypothetical protein
MRDFLGTSVAFPMRPDGRGGLALSVGVEAVEDSLRAIIVTMKGAHQLEPWLGIPIFVFEPMPSTKAAAEVAIGDGGLCQVTIVYQVLGDATTRTLAQGFRAPVAA